MGEVFIAFLTFLGLALPAAAVLSTRRRLLSLARAEADTLAALPKNHPSREVLSEEIKGTVDEYRRYSERGTIRSWLRLSANAFLGLLAVLALLFAVIRYGLDRPTPEPPDWMYHAYGGALAVALLGFFVVFTVSGWTALRLRWEYAKKLSPTDPEEDGPSGVE